MLDTWNITLVPCLDRHGRHGCRSQQDYGGSPLFPLIREVVHEFTGPRSEASSGSFFPEWGSKWRSCWSNGMRRQERTVQKDCKCCQVLAMLFSYSDSQKKCIHWVTVPSTVQPYGDGRKNCLIPSISACSTILLNKKLYVSSKVVKSAPSRSRMDIDISKVFRKTSRAMYVVSMAFLIHRLFFSSLSIPLSR